MIFRFDDICGNTDMGKINYMSNAVHMRDHSAQIVYSISLFHTDMSSFSGKHSEFAFMPIWKAYSDHRKFYEVTEITMPNIPDNVEIASHGLVHADHRQMHFDAQEMSILVSCSLLQTKIFIPPFNKWNADTEHICKAHDIELQKFEDGWLGAEYNAFNISHPLWYTHSFNWTVERFEEWLQ